MVSRLAALLLAVAALLPGVAAGDSPPAGNDFFEVVMEDAAGADGRGTFGVITGSAHPLGAGVELLSLRGADDAFASYLTVHSYTTGTDYVQTLAGPASNNLVVPLDQYAAVAPIPGGYRAAYDVTASSPAAEALGITLDVTVVGSGSDSAVEIDATLVNNNDYPVFIGARLLLDIAADNDDGPVVGLTAVESEITPPPAELSVAPGTAGSYLLTSSPPESVLLAHWNRAFQSAYDFDPDGSDVTSAGGLDDSALLYYFGAPSATSAAAADAIGLAPGGAATVSLILAPTAQEGSPTPTPATSATPSPPPSPGPTPTGAPGAVTPSATPGPAGLPTGGGMLGMSGDQTGGVLLVGLLAVALGAIAAWAGRPGRNLD